jgi:hypothetical protein
MRVHESGHHWTPDALLLTWSVQRRSTVDRRHDGIRSTWPSAFDRVITPMCRWFARSGGQGGTVLHWAKGAGGRGSFVLVRHRDGDDRPKIPQLHARLSEFDPASAKQVTGIAVALEPFQFDTIYGHYFDRVITSGGKRILEISVKRYVDAISGAYEHERSNRMIAAARPRWSRCLPPTSQAVDGERGCTDEILDASPITSQMEILVAIACSRSASR